MTRTVRMLMLFFLFLFTQVSHGLGPSGFTVIGGLYDSSGEPLNGFFDFQIQIMDMNTTCVLYEEVHSSVDLTTTNGEFSLVLGQGGLKKNNVDDSKDLNTAIYRNDIDLPVFTECPSGLSFSPGDSRKLRVSYNPGPGFITLQPDIEVQSTPYSVIAQTLDGKSADQFVQVNADQNLTQQSLADLANGVSTVYYKPGALLDMNSQQIINLPNPVMPGDAATKNYVDSIVSTGIGGKASNLSNVDGSQGDGKILTWDQAGDQWIASIPPAGGDFMADGSVIATGNFNIGGNTISNVADPTNSQDAASKNYVDGKTWSLASITDNGTMASANTADYYTQANLQGDGTAALHFNNITNLPAGLSDGDDNSQLSEASVDAYVANNGFLLSQSLDAAYEDGSSVTVDASDLVYNLSSTQDFHIQDNGAAALTVTDAGDVGVGTATPADKLDVAGNIRAQQLCDETGANCKDISLGWPASSADIDSVTAGTGLSGGGTSGAVTLNIADTAVTAGAYGSATQVPSFTVDAQGRLTAAANVTITDNDTTYSPVTGVADGLMIAADKTKLDGIEASATADQTPAEILTAVLTVDGSTSGLDSDLLDGQSGAHYLAWGNLTGVPADIADGDANTQLSEAAVETFINNADFAMGTNKITGLGDPTLAQDAATKNYVDTQGFLSSETGDIEGVTAGTGLSGGGTSGAVTLNIADTAVTAGAYGSATQVPSFTVDAQGRLTAATNVTITDNDTTYSPVTGVADGLMIAADKTKLDGIEASATADQTPAEILTAVLTVDGSTSGLDSDLLDGQSGAHYLAWGNLTGVPADIADGDADTQLSEAAVETFINNADFAMGTNKITGLGDPTLAQDAATKNYVDTQGFLSSETGDIEGVTAGTGLSGGGNSGAVTLNIADTAVTAGAYGSATQVPSFTVDAQGRLTTAANVTITDNDTTYSPVTGVADGLMIAADKTKLDGIEASATADQTPAEILTAVLTVDGSTSGLDSDLLDGQSGAHYLAWGNLTGVPADIADGDADTQLSEAAVETFINNADFAMGTNKITGLGDPTLAQDAATKNYVDSQGFLSSETGDIEGVAAGTGLSGGGTSGAVTLNIANTAVSAGSYGSATQVPSFTVDAQGRLTTAANVTITDNDTTYSPVTGVADGLMIAADKTKLDGIETSATADQTPAEILTAVLTVDGSTSGLDSDLLDGQSGAHYLAWGNLTGVPADIADGDANTQLSEATVDSYVSDNGFLENGGQNGALTVGTNDANDLTLEAANSAFMKMDQSNGGIYAYYDMTMEKADGNDIYISTDSGSGTASWALGYDDSSNHFAIAEHWDMTSDANKRFIIASGGNVGIGVASPAQKLDVSGNVQASAYFYSSDRRLKEEITDIAGLEKILKLRGVRFKWIKDGHPDVGLIAQEVEKVFPDLVFTNEKTGFKSVQYGNLVAPLIEATKEMMDMIESNRSDIESLKEENKSIRSELEQLKQAVGALTQAKK